MEWRKARTSLLSAIGLFAVSAAAGAAPAPEKAPQNLALVGVTEIGGRSQAWLMDVDSRARETVSPGSSAFGYRVKSVGPERVVLSRGGREFVLRLGDRQVPTVAAAPVRTAAPTVSGRIALPRDRGAIRDVFAPPVFLNGVPDTVTEVEVTPPAETSARELFADPNTDPRVQQGYPGGNGYSANAMAPGYGLFPGYGLPPSYGFDPQAAGYPGFEDYPGVAGYPLYPDEAAGYPGAPFGYPGMAAGYPGYFSGSAQEGYYPGGAMPYPSATAWGSPYAGYSPFVGNGLDLGAPRWSRQSGRRQNVDPFRGEISVNPQTQRRRARFSFPVQGQ